MSKISPAKFRSIKPKKKCCRSRKRCSKCPVVLHRLSKQHAEKMSPKEFAKAYKKARAA
ncbi:hypothetical protein HH308_12660 [Gordonia sp. TBRC 11910]|uniref:Uncharacterized protein n=1 Tax=Gordonia asplenii TaxID=2725283 RepID=A0A848L097_9ACTN|nr:hypothetical protein [Gordonia asplenii]NMO02063.1 hypothetical protein [Gordonia asplenii]